MCGKKLGVDENIPKKKSRRMAGLLLIFLGVLVLLIDHSAKMAAPTPQRMLSDEEYAAAWQEHLANLQNQKVDLNTASYAELCGLNGIGATVAANIIEYRREHGLFTQVEDLLLVDGVGETRLAQLRTQVYIEKPTADAGFDVNMP